MDPFELHPEVKKNLEKKTKKFLTKKEIFGILDTEIKQFKRSDYILVAGILEKIKEKIGKLTERKFDE